MNAEPQSLAEIIAARKARQARFAAAAMRVQSQEKPAEKLPEVVQDNAKPEPVATAAPVLSVVPKKRKTKSPKRGPKPKPMLPTVVYDRPIGPNPPSFFAATGEAPAPECVLEEAPKRTWRQIVREVCEKHGLGWELVRSDLRYPNIVDCRYEIFYRLRFETRLSMPQIAERVGGRDHTTVLNGIRRHRERMAGKTRRADVTSETLRLRQKEIARRAEAGELLSAAERKVIATMAAEVRG